MNLYKKLYYGLVLATMQSIYASIPNSIIETITDASLNNPYAIAITLDDTTAYICNNNGNSVSIIDIATNTVIGTVDDTAYTFNHPQAIAITLNGLTAYVCNAAGNNVNIIDIATNTVTGNISGSFNNPNVITIHPDQTKAYVANYNDATITVIDVTNNTVTGMVIDNGDTLNTPKAIAITPDGTTAYISNYNGNSVSIMDTATDTITGTVNSTSYPFSLPQGIAITPDGTTAYVCNNNNSTINIMNLSTNTVIGRIVTTNGQLNHPNNINITPDGNTTYVTNANNTMSIISTDPLAYAYNTVTSSILSSSISGPQAMAITPNGQYGYICSSSNNSINVLYITSPLTLEAPTDISLITGLLESSTASNYINKMSWTPPTTGPIVAAYKIYRDAELTQLAATISATNVPAFVDYYCTANTLYNYYIVSVDNDGNLSTSLHGSITTLA